MNWLIRKYHINIEYKYFKCRNCGNEIVFNPNIKAEYYQDKLMNLDGSLHNCENKPKKRMVMN